MCEPDPVDRGRLRSRARDRLIRSIALPCHGRRAVIIAVHPKDLAQGKQRADVFLPVQALLRAIVIDGPPEPQYRLAQPVAAEEDVPEAQLGIDVSVAGASEDPLVAAQNLLPG